MDKDDVIKFIDGKVFYYSDYINFLYKQLQLRDEIIKEVREIFKYYGAKEDIVGYSNYTILGEELIKLLELLDKENV